MNLFNSQLIGINKSKLNTFKFSQIQYYIKILRFKGFKSGIKDKIDFNVWN